MKAMIAISLDASEQDCTLNVVGSNGKTTVLHATAGQVHIDCKDGDTITVGGAAKSADKAAA